MVQKNDRPSIGEMNRHSVWSSAIKSVLHTAITLRCFCPDALLVGPSRGHSQLLVGWLIARSVTRLADDIDVPILSSTETPWIESEWSSSQLIWQSCVASTSLSRLLKTFNLGLLALNLCLLASQKCLELQDLVWYLVAQLMLAFAWFRCVTRESIAVLADVWVLWDSCLPIT